jgi:hypothetical protein
MTISPDELAELLESGSEIEGYCVACDATWSISTEERADPACALTRTKRLLGVRSVQLVVVRRQAARSTAVVGRRTPRWIDRSPTELLGEAGGLQRPSHENPAAAHAIG